MAGGHDGDRRLSWLGLVGTVSLRIGSFQGNSSLVVKGKAASSLATAWEEPSSSLFQRRSVLPRSNQGGKHVVKTAVIGTGYVGLVQGTCLAESGNDVICIDKVASKIDSLQQGKIPIYEPGLAELVHRNQRDGRLSFTTDLAGGIAEAEIVFIAVGTPQGADGAADLTGVWAVGDQIAKNLRAPKTIVIKSTVPVGTNTDLVRRMGKVSKVPFETASNPEFLKEGAAVEDFNKPDRVVVGVRRTETAERLHSLYAPFLRTDRPFLVMTPESAEMTKYVANCLLAAKISFINEMANLCEALGADINDVRRGIGHDQRIGFHFLHPGVGYGGSCFPKDIRAVIHMAQSQGLPARMMEAVDSVNEAQKNVLFHKLDVHFEHSLRGKTIAIWGLAFKPRTDDIREAPALVLIDSLLEAGAHLRVHDPEALENAHALYGQKLTYCDRPYGALEQADALVITTEWNEFRNPDFEVMLRLLRQPVVFDGRNVYDPARMAALGFTYHSIGRARVDSTPLPKRK
jgi:UDPglucose 6-dehydrogenase